MLSRHYPAHEQRHRRNRDKPKPPVCCLPAVYIHVEAPDECGHRGEIENKVKAIELIDEHILKPVTDFLRTFDDFAVLVCPDHPTPLSIRTHTSNPVPYLIYDSKNEVDSGVSKFCEEEAKKTGNYIEKGFTMMDYFLSK